MQSNMQKTYTPAEWDELRQALPFLIDEPLHGGSSPLPPTSSRQNLAPTARGQNSQQASLQKTSSQKNSQKASPPQALPITPTPNKSPANIEGWKGLPTTYAFGMQIGDAQKEGALSGQAAMQAYKIGADTRDANLRERQFAYQQFLQAEQLENERRRIRLSERVAGLEAAYKQAQMQRLPFEMQKVQAEASLLAQKVEDYQRMANTKVRIPGFDEPVPLTAVRVLGARLYEQGDIISRLEAFKSGGMSDAGLRILGGRLTSSQYTQLQDQARKQTNTWVQQNTQKGVMGNVERSPSPEEIQKVYYQNLTRAFGYGMSQEDLTILNGYLEVIVPIEPATAAPPKSENEQLAEAIAAKLSQGAKQ